VARYGRLETGGYGRLRAAGAEGKTREARARKCFFEHANKKLVGRQVTFLLAALHLQLGIA
jgi:hypothetical protein